MNKTMRKNSYTAPVLRTKEIAQELPVAQSNQVTDGSGVNLNPSTMEEGDGGDGVKANRFNVWDDDWSHR